MSATKRGRAGEPRKTWRFTCNNYTAAQQATVESWAPHSVNVLVVSQEVGDSGTPHLQGYVTFKQAKRLAAVKKLLNAHWEEAIAKDDGLYEKKEGSVVIVDYHGGKQGARTDLGAAYAAARAAQTTAEFMAQEPGWQSLKVFEKASFTLNGGRKATDPLEVHWLSGSTGTGKTRFAYALDPDAYVCMDFKWWDGYEGQKTIIIDDYRKDFCKFHELLTLLDRYPQRRQIKGGWVRLNHRSIIITSPQDALTTWMGRTEEDIKQLERRITHTWSFLGADRVFMAKTGLPGQEATLTWQEDGTVTVTEVEEGNTGFLDDLAIYDDPGFAGAGWAEGGAI